MVNVPFHAVTILSSRWGRGLNCLASNKVWRHLERHDTTSSFERSNISFISSTVDLTIKTFLLFSSSCGSCRHYKRICYSLFMNADERKKVIKSFNTQRHLGTWWWGRIPPNQPYPKGAAPAATTLLAEWPISISRRGVKKKKKTRTIRLSVIKDG